MAFSHWLFLQNTPSQMFGRVLALDYLSCFDVVLRGIHGKIDIYQTYIHSKLGIFLYFEVIHGSTTFKLKKRWSIIKFDVFILCFLHSTVPNNKCDKQKWYVLFFYIHQNSGVGMCWGLHLRSHALNEEDCHFGTKGKIFFNLF